MYARGKNSGLKWSGLGGNVGSHVIERRGNKGIGEKMTIPPAESLPWERLVWGERESCNVVSSRV